MPCVRWKSCALQSNSDAKRARHPNSFAGTKHFEELRVRIIYEGVAIANGTVSAIRDQESNPKRIAFTDDFGRCAGK